MKRFFICFSLCLFLLYWGTTLLFIAPENPVSTPFFEKNKVFHYFLGQNWSLFVPPPKDNKKIYYTFYHKNSEKTIRFEVLESLLKRKIENAPFNSSESIRDYILFNSGSAVVWWSENYELEEMDQSAAICSEEEALAEKNEFIQSTYHFQMLKSYALVVAREHHIPLHDYEVSFTLAKVVIPDFEHRRKLMDKRIVLEEMEVFESEKFSLVP